MMMIRAFYGCSAWTSIQLPDSITLFLRSYQMHFENQIPSNASSCQQQVQLLPLLVVFFVPLAASKEQRTPPATSNTRKKKKNNNKTIRHVMDSCCVNLAFMFYVLFISYNSPQFLSPTFSSALSSSVIICLGSLTVVPSPQSH